MSTRNLFMCSLYRHIRILTRLCFIVPFPKIQRQQMTPRQSDAHPWRNRGRQLENTKYAAHLHFYAIDADDNVYAFRKVKSRAEWILQAEGRQILAMRQVRLKKYRDKLVIRLDENQERKLIDAYNRRKRKEGVKCQ